MFEELVLKELIRNGYSKEKGRRSWNIAHHRILYSSPQLVQGFLNVQRFPRYKANVIDRELDLIKGTIPSLFKGSTSTFNLVDLGCGDGGKAAAFIKSLPSTVQTRYYAVDTSPILTHLARTKITSLGLRSTRFGGSFLQDFSSLDTVMRSVRKTSHDRSIFLLLGSTLASFEINELLFSLSQSMKHGDILVIGNGIRTGKRFTGAEKYRHPAFSAWFMPVMEGLGFSAKEVSYITRFSHNRLEFVYRVKSDKIFVCNGTRIKFKAGDEIIVAMQYKYFARELEKFCTMYFSDVRLFNDKNNEYALVYCVK